MRKLENGMWKSECGMRKSELERRNEECGMMTRSPQRATRNPEMESKPSAIPAHLVEGPLILSIDIGTSAVKILLF